MRGKEMSDGPCCNECVDPELGSNGVMFVCDECNTFMCEHNPCSCNPKYPTKERFVWLKCETFVPVSLAMKVHIQSLNGYVKSWDDERSRALNNDNMKVVSDE